MPPRGRRRFLSRLWRDVRSWGDPMQRELGVAGELLVAKIRLALVVLLLVIPIQSVVIDRGQNENWIGLLTGIVAALFAVVFLRLAQRPRPPRRLPFVTSQFDVAMISLGSVGFAAAGSPLTATNSQVHYSIYFVALAGTALRFDPWVCAAAGAAATLQHGAIIAWVASSWPIDALISEEYGRFSWDNQVGRLELLLVVTLIQIAAVVRSRRFWLRSMRDRLTNLYNRGFFEESLIAHLGARSATSELLIVALADLDRFKSINDALGHPAGDQALRRVAETMRKQFRETDLVARYGGEEFGVLLDGASLAAAAERLEAFRAALAADPREPRLTISIGVASFPADGATAPQLLAAADRRLYAAKHAGRDRLVSVDS